MTLRGRLVRLSRTGPGSFSTASTSSLLPRETVALVGESGAGKSTVAALLLRLREPTAGRVSVGGVDLASCDPQAWRRAGRVAAAAADALPRHASPRTSGSAIRTRPTTRFGTPRGCAGADAFVRRLPDGYDTVVGDGGRPLSAGEAQRIALARVLVRAAPLVILDEPTANLDPESAELVAEAIDRLRGQCTVLLITHSAGAARRADRLVRLVGGRAATVAAAA